MIRTDLTLLQQQRRAVNSSLDSVSRLLEALPGCGGELKNQLDKLQPNIENMNAVADDAP